MAHALTPTEIARRTKVAAFLLRELKKLFPSTHTMLRYKTPWELLVAVILSAQCTDKKVNKVTAVLFKKYRKLNDYVRAKPSEFQKDIHATGFFRNKTKSILAAARIVQSEFGGKVPRTMQEMITIPGVGRKTANVVLGNAYGVVEGIAVDTHVKRLALQWGLSTEKNPDKIERDLMRVIPKKEWFRFTYYLISYGRTYCPARKHAIAQCPLHRLS